MNKNILVVSHERSGTHFLINSISENLDYKPGWVDVYAKDSINPDEKYKKKYKHNIEKFFTKKFGGKYNKIFKSHHQSSFLDNIIDDILGEFCVFYIVRDPRDTLTSCFHYFHKSKVDAFPKPSTVEELMFSIKPYEYPFDGAYSYEPSENFLDRWALHVRGWIKYQNEIKVVRYTDLKNDFVNLIGRVAEAIGGDAPESVRVPSLHVNTVCPRIGVEGDWMSHLDNETNNRVCEFVHSCGLGSYLVDNLNK